MNKLVLNGVASAMFSLGMYSGVAQAHSSYITRGYSRSQLPGESLAARHHKGENSSSQMANKQALTSADLVQLPSQQAGEVELKTGKAPGFVTEASRSASSELVLQSGAQTRSLVVIDASVPDKQLFIRQLMPGQASVVIDADENGLDQLIAALNQYTGLDSLHIISHAEAGVLHLGNASVTSEQLGQKVSFFNGVNNALKPGADIHFYGCDLAAGVKGEAFLDIVKANTHADIAASDDLTGSMQQEGDWELEITRGDINTDAPFSAVAMKDFSAVLAYSGTLTFDGVDTSGYAATLAYNNVGSSSYNMVMKSNAGGSNDLYFFDGDFLYIGTGGSSAGHTATDIYFTNGEGFDLTSLYVMNTSGLTKVIRVTSDKGGSVDSSSLANGSSQTLNFSGAQWQGVTNVTVAYSDGSKMSWLRIDDMVLANTAPGADADGNLIAGGGVSEPVALPTIADTVGEAVNVFDFALSDGGGGDGLSLGVSQIVLNVSGTASDAQRANVTWRLNGNDASNVTGVYDAGSDTITFSGLSVSVADGGSETYTVNAYYNDNSNLAEDLTYILSVDGDTDLTVSGSGTQMGATTAVTNGSGSTVDVTATALAFTTQPAGSTSGSALTTQPVVTAQDAFGNTDVDFTETVSLTEASAGTLTNNAAAASSGVATFSGLTYTATADQQSFTLTANDQDGVGSNLSTVDANAVTSDVVATKLVFDTQPSPLTVDSGVAEAFTTVPVVSVRDANDVVDTGYSTDITLAEVNGAGSATMTGTGDNDGSGATVSVTPSSGVSTFTSLNLTYTAAGSSSENFNLQASSGGLTTTDSSQMTAIVADTNGDLTAAGGVSEPVALPTTVDTVGEAVNVFDFSISDGGGDGLSLGVSEVVLNVSGTASDTQRANVTWRLNGNDASNVTGTYNAGSGTVTFSGLSISIADGGNETYTVNAYYNDNTGLAEDLTYILSVDGDTDLTVGGSGTQMGATSAVTNGAGSTVDVTATALAFTTQPAGSTSGSALTTQPVVTAQDAFGNTDVDFTETVSLTEASAGTLINNTAAASSGVATFSGLAYTATADQQSFTLTANDQDGVGSNLSTVDANAVTSDVVATKLVFDTQPSPLTVDDGVAEAFTTVPVVSARDANDVVDTGYSTGIALAEVNGAGSAAMTGTGDTDGNGATVTITPSSGTSTFTGLSLTYNASGGSNETFNLQASSGGLSTTNSSQLTAVVNQPPTDISLDSTAINQSDGVNGVVGNLSSTDSDSSSFTYSLVAGTGDTNNASFNINSAQLRANDAGALSAGNYSVRIQTEDDNGGTYQEAFTITVVDDVAPAAPTTPDLDAASDTGSSSSDDLTADTTPTLSGTAEAGSTVTVSSSLDGTLGTTTADGSGNWSYTPASALSSGSHDFTATATDAANNTGSASSALAVTIDTTAPSVPGVPDLNAGSDSGSSNSDDLTADTTPTLSGTATAGVTVTVISSIDGTLGTTTADGSGNWTYTPGSAVSSGSHNFTATATDDAGNISGQSSALAVNIDTSAPAAPGAPDLAAASDTGNSSTDNVTADTTPTLSGTAEAGSTVTVTSSLDGVLGTTPADGSGNWSFTPGSVVSNGSHNFTVTATDDAGNTGSVSSALGVNIDTSAPAAPATPDLAAASDLGDSDTDNLTSDTTPTLSGTAEAGSIVTVSSSIDGSLGTTTADGSGNWSYTPGSTLSDGSHNFTATATDDAGNTGSASSALGVTIDTSAPSAPGAPDLDAGSDSGSSDVDNITNDTSPSLSGTAEVGSTVTISSSLDGSLGTTTADGSGNWSFTPGSAVSSGSHNVTVTATDEAGNTSSASSPLALTIDTTAPSASAAPDLAAASDSGSSSTDDITNDTTPTLNGSGAEAGSTVTVTSSVDGTLGTTTADGSGNWSFTPGSALSSGSYNITVTVQDVAGNTGPASSALALTVDTSAPSAPSTADLDAASDTGSSSTDNVTADTTPTLSGTAEAGSTVTVSSSLDGSLGTATADGSGNWSFTPGSALSEGSHNLTASATDVAGNTGSASSALSVTVDATAPSAPGTPDLDTASDSGSSDTDNITNDTTPSLSGSSAEAGSLVAVTSSLDGSLGTTTADGSGNWSLTPGSALSEGDHNLTVTATDAAGNTSSASSALGVTVDTSAPSAPGTPDLDAASDSGSSDTDNITSDTTPSLSGGSAEAGSTVTVSSSLDGSLGTTTADGSGNWSFTPGSALSEGDHNLTVTATDVAGNTGSASSALSVTVDTSAPAAPNAPDLDAVSDSGDSNSDDVTNNTTPDLSGSGAEPNGLVAVTSSVAGALGSATADGSGNWSLTVGSALSEGDHSMTVTTTDAAGNTSTDSSALVVTIDTTGPSAEIQNAPTTSAGAFDIDIVFAEAVSNFDVNDITVSNANLSAFAGSGDSYSVTVTPVTAGTDVELSIAAGVADDAAGNANTASSTVTVATNNPGQATISGSAVVGQTLTAAVTDADGASGASFTYQWMSAGGNVGASSDTYVLQGSDEGNAITVRVTYTDDLGTAEDITSAATAPVISIQQDALNTISSTAGNSGVTTLDVDDYKNAGVSNVTDEELTRILSILNRAVANQVDPQDVDSVAEIEALIDTIMEGQDDDGDGLPNLFEGTVDTDTDGIADRDDVDADNDGIRDNLEVLANLDDSDADGVIDLFDADVDGDGTLETGKLDDNLDGVDDNLDSKAEFVTVYTDADKDGDGSLNYLDIDADNDGVPDILEAGLPDTDGDALFDAGGTLVTDSADLPDTDADTTPDYLQLISDGASRDLIVYGLPATLDANEDGQLDATIDMDNDGLLDVVDNAVGAFGSLPDLDGDGLPNHIDSDDDGDGIPDVDENPRQGSFTGMDADADGIDDGVDFEVNGTTFGTDTNNNGVQDAYEMPDRDNDGIADHLDNDSDNDNVTDDLDPSVNTGTDVQTTDSTGSTTLLALFGLLALLLARHRKAGVLIGALLLSGSGFAGDWSAGFGIGQAEFDPDLNAGLELTRDDDTAMHLMTGYQFDESWLLMLRVADFGEAKVGNGRIAYEGAAVMTRYTLPFSYPFMAFYGQLGISDVDAEGQGGLNVDDNSGLRGAFGGGVSFPLDKEHGVTLSLEATSYTDDVVVFGLELRTLIGP